MGLSFAMTIFLFIVCLCGGIAIGIIFSRFKNLGSEIPSDKVEKEAGKENASPVQSSLAEGEDSGILRACIDNSGKAWLEMDGQRLKSEHPMQEDQKKRLMKLVSEMHAWLDDPAVSEIRPTASPGKQDRGPSRKPIFGKQKVIPPVTDATQIHPGSIVNQIEAILQNKLSGTGFEEKNIHLLEGKDGEVLVQIGQEKFVGVDAVANEDIKELIRKAVVAWENGTK